MVGCMELEGGGAGPADAPFSPPPREPVAKRSGGRRAATWLSIALVLALLGMVLTAVFHGPSSFSCRNHADPSEPIAFTAYLETNIARPDDNAIMVIRYAADDHQPLPIDCFRTGGRGSTDLEDTGVLDSDQQVVIHDNRLYAINQGSDTIAAFDILEGGDLRALPGSPFPSGGTSPVSLGFSGDHVLVVNKAHDGYRDLSDEAPNFTSFTVNDDGSLTPVPGSTVDLPLRSNPAQALISPDGTVMFGTSPGGFLRSYQVHDDGTFTEAPGSPQRVSPAAYPPSFPERKRFAVGLAVHPTRPIMYADLPPASGLAAYTYAPDGEMTFASSVANTGSWFPCWTVITKDGRFLYTANAGSNTVSAFDISTPLSPIQLQAYYFLERGNPWNLALDPTDSYLVVLTPRDLPNVPEGEGNEVHLMRISDDGTLEEQRSALVELPLPDGTNPIGLAIR